MRDCQRPTAGDLLAEFRNDAAGRTEHVAEANHDDTRAFRPESLAQKLGKPLRRTHDVRGVDCLVGGDEHQFLDPVRYSRLRDSPRSERVVPHCLPGVRLFHERHVLVGGGMEHDGWPVRLHRPRKACSILHVSDQAYDGHSGKSREELLLDLVKAELVRFEENQLLRSELRKLAAKLGADRASGARDQRRSTLQPLAQAGAIEPHRIAAEQVIELDRANLGISYPAGHEVLVGRDRHCTDSCSTAQL